MSDPIANAGSRATLRQQAHQQLTSGLAPPSRDWGVSVEALALLHRLASTPASAADALKLLHELQVHQVELDLQQAQLEANEHELADDLARYRALFEQGPIPHFVLDVGSRIVECNRAAAILLGSGSADVIGRSLDEFLTADSQLPLAALLRDVRSGAANPFCVVRPVAAADDSRHWRLAASTLPTGDAIQLVVTDSAASPEG